MSKRLLIAAAASLLLGVLGQGVAGAAPTPKYTVTCVVGDRTIARWQRARLSKVTLDWSAPLGSVTAGTPLNPNPATATATFTPADGSPPDVVTVNCS